MPAHMEVHVGVWHSLHDDTEASAAQQMQAQKQSSEVHVA